MKLLNSTNIPNRAIETIYSLVELDGISIYQLVVRNKKKSTHYGTWGYYFPAVQSIAIYIPHEDHYPISSHRTNYNDTLVTLNSRIEHLLYTLAHEVRHAWQFQVKWDKFKYQCSSPRKLSKIMEWDAEHYSYEKLQWWKGIETRKVASNSN